MTRSAQGGGLRLPTEVSGPIGTDYAATSATGWVTARDLRAGELTDRGGGLLAEHDAAGHLVRHRESLRVADQREGGDAGVGAEHTERHPRRPCGRPQLVGASGSEGGEVAGEVARAVGEDDGGRGAAGVGPCGGAGGRGDDEPGAAASTTPVTSAATQAAAASPTRARRAIRRRGEPRRTRRRGWGTRGSPGKTAPASWSQTWSGGPSSCAARTTVRSSSAWRSRAAGSVARRSSTSRSGARRV